MAQQWFRKSSLLISIGSASDNNKSLIDLSELEFKFQTQASTVYGLASIQMRIFNPAYSTIKSILDEGTQIFLNAGYDGSFGQIFSGNIIQVRVGRENATDTYIDISATDGDNIYNQSFVNSTIAAGSNKTARLQNIAIAGGFSFTNNPIIIDDGVKLPRGRVYFGLARDHLRPLCATLGADWMIVDGKVSVVSQNAYADNDTILLNYATGMIGLPVQTLEGIAIKCLLNPSIKQAKKVHIDNSAIQQFQADLGWTGSANNILLPPLSEDGDYRVLYCSHSGNTRGQDWYTDLIGMSGDQITRQSQLQYQYMSKY